MGSPLVEFASTAEAPVSTGVGAETPAGGVSCCQVVVPVGAPFCVMCVAASQPKEC